MQISAKKQTRAEGTPAVIDRIAALEAAGESAGSLLLAVQLALAELAEAQEEAQTATELALAELAGLVEGGDA